jgi:predicted Zn-dependent protease
LCKSRNAEAAEGFGRVLSLLPDLPQARIGVGAALLAFDQHHRTREVLEMVQRHDPNCIDARGFLINLLEKDGDFARAE